MTRLFTLLFLTFLVATFLAPACLADKPNVILIMTDDQGYGDLSTHGNPWIKTPNIDKLAAQSVRLDDYHVSPYCVPTRASLLTGRYADRTGIHNVLSPDFITRADEFIMSTSFKQGGYATGMFGKWHLGDNYPFGPEHRGFDQVLRHYGGAIGVLADYWDNCYLDDTYFENGVPTKVNGYCTDVFFAAARQFIKDAVEQGKPFFVYLPTNAPHGPRICPPKYAEPYKKGRTSRLATFYGMIANIDENLGKLRTWLRKEGLSDNTIFIFTTDNGSAAGAGLFNAGMKGKKGSTYDGGHRVPFFLHWPAGGFDYEKRIETLTAHLDVFPTLLDLCGLEKPKRVKMDGVSLRPLLEKGDHSEWPDRIIMTDNQKRELPRKWATTAVMSERWRLIDGKELYDINADPGQENNVINEQPQVVAKLSAWYDDLWNELEPSFQDPPEIPLGYDSASTVTLNYHDCIGRHPFWFQDGIRSLRGNFGGQTKSLIDAADSQRSRAFWPVNVITDGEYIIELRRFPRELDARIRADIPPGDLVFGHPSHRSKKGIGFPATEARLWIGDTKQSVTVTEEATAATFRTKLAKGSHQISAQFIADNGTSLDSFYVYVRKTR